MAEPVDMTKVSWFTRVFSRFIYLNWCRIFCSSTVGSERKNIAFVLAHADPSSLVDHEAFSMTLVIVKHLLSFSTKLVVS